MLLIISGDNFKSFIYVFVTALIKSCLQSLYFTAKFDISNLIAVIGLIEVKS